MNHMLVRQSFITLINLVSNDFGITIYVIVRCDISEMKKLNMYPAAEQVNQ